MKNIMKKSLSCILVISMLLTLTTVFAVGSVSAEGIDTWDGTVGTAFDGGSGTAGDPYLISSAETLAYLASVVNSGVGMTAESSQYQKFFKLTCDIDLNNLAWTPIGHFYAGTMASAVCFSGSFDGNGHKIYNLNTSTYANGLAAANSGAGLFGAFAIGTIQNLGIESGTVTCSSGAAGGIAAYMAHANAVLKNCYNKATIVKADNSTWTMMGGLVGWVYAGSITDCVNYGAVDGSVATTWNGNNCFGGIAGIINGTILLENCESFGKVSSGNCRGGGLVGRTAGTVTVKNCSASGEIVGTNAQRGILFGIVEGGTYENLKAYTANQSDSNVTAVGSDASGLTTGKITVVEKPAEDIPSAMVDVWDGTVGTAFDGGSGTSADPYLISSGKTLAYLASVVNSGVGMTAESSQYQKFFKLTCDIDLNNLAWTPIGYYCDGAMGTAVCFSGSFDGDGHVIYNLNATTYANGKTAANACAGLFGAFAIGTIQNLGIESGTVTCTSGAAGGLVGYMAHANAVLKNCYNKATIVNPDSSAGYMGGLVGRANAGSIQNCINYGNVGKTANAVGYNNAYNFGGIAGYNAAKMTACSNFGNISAGGCRAGGLIGWQASGSVENCYSSGNVISENGNRGILIGRTAAGTFANLTYYSAKQTEDDIAVTGVATGESDLTVGAVTEVFAEMLTGASVRCADPTGLRFETVINADQYELWLAEADSVRVGTLIAPSVYVTAAGAFTKDALDAYKTANNLASAAYIDVVYDAEWRAGSTESEYVFAGSIVNILPANYSLDFAAVGYIAVTEGDTTTYYYASYTERDNFRSIKTVVNSVLEDPDNGLSVDQLAVVTGIKETIDAYESTQA